MLFGVGRFLALLDSCFLATVSTVPDRFASELETRDWVVLWQNLGMSWLVSKDRVLATLEVADTWQSRIKGVVGRGSIEGALLIKPACSVHTLGVKFSLDIAYCDRELCIIDIVTMAPNRIGKIRPRSRAVIEAPKGSFERWGVKVGDQLEVRQ